jgi:hypothetical protein
MAPNLVTVVSTWWSTKLSARHRPSKSMLKPARAPSRASAIA